MSFEPQISKMYSVDLVKVHVHSAGQIGWRQAEADAETCRRRYAERHCEVLGLMTYAFGSL